MLRCRLRMLGPSAVVQRCRSSSARAGTAGDDDVRTARAWLAGLHAETIPLKSIGELSFSRSSGPGGQNVNKVNSKATLKVPLDALLTHVPTALHGEIKRSRYVAARSSTVILQADDSRKQSDNALRCYQRLFDAIVEAGRRAVPNETSTEQAQHVKQLQRTDNERRLQSKKQQSAKKSSRRCRGHD
ncbi:hypothetical protein ACEQ8H_000902 [Pleosporales sp. CAS-2024a]